MQTPQTSSGCERNVSRSTRSARSTGDASREQLPDPAIAELLNRSTPRDTNGRRNHRYVGRSC